MSSAVRSSMLSPSSSPASSASSTSSSSPSSASLSTNSGLCLLRDLSWLQHRTTHLIAFLRAPPRPTLATCSLKDHEKISKVGGKKTSTYPLAALVEAKRRVAVAVIIGVALAALALGFGAGLALVVLWVVTNFSSYTG